MGYDAEVELLHLDEWAVLGVVVVHVVVSWKLWGYSA